MPKVTCQEYNQILKTEMTWASDMGMRLERIEPGLAGHAPPLSPQQYQTRRHHLRSPI